MYLENIKDIDTELEDNLGNIFTVRAGFNRFTHTKQDGTQASLFHSVHKTNWEGVITLLVDKGLVPAAEQTLLGIHTELLQSMPAETHEHIFFPDRQVQLTGRVIDSASSLSYASLFDNIIASNPQGGDDDDPPTKIPKIQLSYAHAAMDNNPTGTKEAETLSEITDNDLETLLTRMKAKFGDFAPVKAHEFEATVQTQVKQAMQQLDIKLETRLKNMEASFDKNFPHFHLWNSGWKRATRSSAKTSTTWSNTTTPWWPTSLLKSKPTLPFYSTIRLYKSRVHPSTSYDH